jgi:phosphatidate cytidylyltransferase
MSRDLATRLTTSIFGIPLMLFIFYTGGNTLLIFLAIVSILGTLEFDKMLLKNEPSGIITNLAVSLCFYLFVSISKPISYAKLEILFLLMVLTAYQLIIVPLFTKSTLSLRKSLQSILGWIYTGILCGFVFRLGNDYKHQQVLLLLLVLIWITDSAAYFIGMRFGKHRGIFPVSPKKSAEGFFAGLLAPCIMVVIIVVLTDFWTVKLLLLLALSAGLFGQLGDLLESKIKRTSGVKDSGKIIPGHGGVLDRFDSLLLAAPVMYVLTKLLI